ncbi:MAG TPA: GWxTD domain-containing protein [Gemmatimonadales bacterium]|nr:GWxTD domain-containing protein [Gemmatimonadales bacterium]
MHYRACRRAASLFAFGVSLLAAPSGIAAQAPEDRLALERLRDSLAAVTDTVALSALEAAGIERAKADRNNTLLHLRLGFIALRLGELASKSHYDDAASEFQWSIDLEPEWPYPWFGMGLAEYGVGDSRVSVVAGLQTMLGKDALTRSAVAFARSAQVDPSFVVGLVELAGTALRQRVNIKLGVALDALRQAAATASGGHPEILLARGRVEREVGHPDSAIAAFRRYVATGPNRALGLLEVARTGLMSGRLDAQLAYYEGASTGDAAALAAYRSDLALIAPDSVLEAFDRSSSTARSALLREFWGERDKTELQVPGSRLAEHYRRFYYARRNFALATTNRHYDIVERFRSGSPDFDDRGIIYLRHGAPDARASYHSPNVPANESWRYTRPDGDLVFHFISREDVQDYKLVESIFDVLGFSGAVLLQETERTPVLSELGSRAEELLLSREQLSPMYARLQRVGRVSAARYQADERRLGRESLRVGTTTDSYGLRFAKELPARTEVLAVGAVDGRPIVHVAYAIPGSALVPVRMNRGFMYAVRLRFMALDDQGEVVASLDTTRRFLAAQEVPAGEHLVGRVAVPVAEGVLTYRLALQQGEDAGVVSPRDSLRAVNSAPVGPRLSDVVLGSRSANLVWEQAAGDTVFFNPLRTYRTGESMRVFYEVLGIPAGERYATQVAVKRGDGERSLLQKIFGGGGAAITVRFEEEATPSRGVQREISLEKLKPGMYTLEVMVTDDEGRRDRRQQRFQVVE